MIEIHLDLVDYTLGYTINDKYCDIAFNKIEPGNYRLAIGLHWRFDESQFLFTLKKPENDN